MSKTYDVETMAQGGTFWMFFCSFDHFPTCQGAMRVSLKFDPHRHHRIIERDTTPPWAFREVVTVPARRMTGDAWGYV